MRLPLHRIESDCFKLIYENVLAGEETQELVVPDVCEDVAKILDVQGQVLLVSKRAAGDKISLSCAVEATVVYIQEPGGEPQVISAIIPVELGAALEGADENLLMSVRLELCGLDARLLNPRKLLLRAHLQAYLCCYLRDSFARWDSLPEGSTQSAEMLEKELCHSLVTDVCEKTFTVSDELALTEKAAGSRLLATNTQLRTLESKAVGNKVVFKAVARTEALFMTPDCEIFTCCFETPFSQIIETQAMSEDCDLHLVLQLRACEFVMLPNREEGEISANFQICAQASCCTQMKSAYIADAYSNKCGLGLETAEINTRQVISQKPLRMKMTAKLPPSVSAADICYIAPVEMSTEIKGRTINCAVTVRGAAHLEGGELQAMEFSMSDSEEMVLGDNQALRIIDMYCEPPSISLGGELCLEMCMELEMYEKMCIKAVCALEISEEPKAENSGAPSLIVLCGRGPGGLWDVAKKYGSTMALIEKINSKGEAFDINLRPLLIPRA